MCRCVVLDEFSVADITADSSFMNRTYAETLDIGGNHTGLPLQVALIFIICVSPDEVQQSALLVGAKHMRGAQASPTESQFLVDARVYSPNASPLQVYSTYLRSRSTQNGRAWV
jgi:hypothetical protein